MYVLFSFLFFCFVHRINLHLISCSFYQFSLVYIFSYRWLTAAAAMQWIPYITHHYTANESFERPLCRFQISGIVESNDRE